MLVWVCALHCEAKPVIDHYRLQKLSAAQPFDWYYNDEMICVISGIGKIAAAAAVASTAEKLLDENSLAWINLGVAGTADDPLGSAFLINKCTDSTSGTSFYPAMIGKTSLPGRTCLTASSVVEDYHGNYLYDMEASGYFQAAQYYSSSELVHSIKVISDNRTEKTGKSKQQTSALVADNMNTISEQASQLVKLNTEHAARLLNKNDLAAFLELAHFSETRKHQLSHLLNYLRNRNYGSETLLRRCRGLSAAQIIQQLEQLGQADSRDL